MLPLAWSTPFALVREVLLALGNVPRGLWVTAIFTTFAACQAPIAPPATAAAAASPDVWSTLQTTLPAFVAALGSFAYAVKARASSGAEAAKAVADALQRRDTEYSKAQKTVERLVARVEQLSDGEHRCRESLLEAEHRYERNLTELRGQLDDLRASVRGEK
jgi:cell division protein FtsB